MTTTEIVADTTGDHGAHPAADGTAVAREVTNYDGTFEEAMECGLIEKFPRLSYGTCGRRIGN